MKKDIRSKSKNTLLALSIASSVSFACIAYALQPNDEIPVGKNLTIPNPPALNDKKPAGRASIVSAGNLPGPVSHEISESINQAIVTTSSEKAEYIQDSEIAKNRFEQVADKSIPVTVIDRLLTFSKSDASSATQTYLELGAVPGAETSSANGKKWANLNRYYSLENGDQMMISEFDYYSANTDITIVSELLNASVSGTPASFRYFESENNNRVAVLSWVTERIAYTIFLSGQVSDKETDKLMLLEVAHNLK